MEELKLKEAEEVNGSVVGAAVEAANPAEEQKEFPAASDAKTSAGKAFRRRLVMILNEAIETGVNKITLDVSGVCDEAVDAAEKDLKAEGYEIRFNNVVKVKRGYTSRVMIVEY